MPRFEIFLLMPFLSAQLLPRCVEMNFEITCTVIMILNVTVYKYFVLFNENTCTCGSIMFFCGGVFLAIYLVFVTL